MLLRVYAGIFALAAFGASWMAWSSDPTSWLPNAAICLVVIVGLLLRRRWSEHLLFGVALAAGISWTTAIGVLVWRQGFPESEPLLSIVISLVPGVAMVGFWTVMFLLVRAQFQLLKPN
jgi:hypothetical protein